MVFLLGALGASLIACGADNSRAVLTLAAGAEHFPCLGVRRLRVSAFRNEVEGKSVEVFGQYYNLDGACNLPAGLPLELSDLPLTNRMWILVEGFDSSEKRRMCMGQTAVLGPDEVGSGDLGQLTLERERLGDIYVTGTLVIPDLPDVASVGDMDSLSFIVNAGTPGSINGSFLNDPRTNWGDSVLVLSNLSPQLDNEIIVVARKDGVPVGTWQNTDFDLPDGQMFVEVTLEKTN